VRGSPIDLAAVAAARRRLLVIAQENPWLLTEPNAENRAAWEVALQEMEADVGRPTKTAEPTRALALRLPESLIDGVDRYVEHLVEEMPGANLTRSDAFRMLLLAALKEAGIDVAGPKARTK
jgi:hypothetical protein